MSGLLHDRRDLGVGHEALPTLLVPVEHDPDAVVLGGVAEDERALGAVLLALLGAVGREDVEERAAACSLSDRPLPAVGDTGVVDPAVASTTGVIRSTPLGFASRVGRDACATAMPASRRERMGVGATQAMAERCLNRDQGHLHAEFWACWTG